MDQLVGELARDASSEALRLVEADYPGVVLRGVGQVIGEAREMANMTLNSAGDFADLAISHLPGVTRSH